MSQLALIILGLVIGLGLVSGVVYLSLLREQRRPGPLRRASLSPAAESDYLSGGSPTGHDAGGAGGGSAD